MKIEKTSFEGLIVIKPDVYTDSRGYFFESFNQEAFNREGISFKPVQDNESRSSRGVIRGLHYQLSPRGQAKLIRVVEGRIFDVALDLRKKSPTFGKWYGIELDSESKTQLLIPVGFAHGFSVLSDIAVIQYKCDNTYSKEHERGILLNDPALTIDWKTDPSVAIISAKDLNNPVFSDAEFNF
ncbi:MAG: dTDP-4-dehydrorhamnose 3,5-epimerase [Bacteroidales bacterium]|jgi:dTDP-4-dehydrorhamnose 3,5-epimerase|nr:dTDP-4-dehydrorhamnose 3,5-epimerase [Bacteroidales bacterium]MCU0407698.1 dTDP-4-dehydrorhamnose 3,5-epimerase [Bacteroidales bacterium]